MQDRNAYRLHSQVRATRRQHYAEANAPRKPAIPTWLALVIIVACIGIAGRFARLINA